MISCTTVVSSFMVPSVGPIPGEPLVNNRQLDVLTRPLRLLAQQCFALAFRHAEFGTLDAHCALHRGPSVARPILDFGPMAFEPTTPVAMPAAQQTSKA